MKEKRFNLIHIIIIITFTIIFTSIFLNNSNSTYENDNYYIKEIENKDAYIKELENKLEYKDEAIKDLEYQYNDIKDSIDNLREDLSPSSENNYLIVKDY